MRFRSADRRLAVDAPAKLNLYLRVLGPRADGFHELETVMAPLYLADTLTFQTCPNDTNGRLSFHLQTCENTVPAGNENLVCRAVELLRQITGITSGLRITLRKRIPAQAGLAGGSSNAAATLLALNRLWQLNLSAERLLELGGRLGSDVNFFVAGARPAICRGRGEIVESHPALRPWPVVVVQPHSGLSTAEVFRHWSSDRDTPSADEFLRAYRRDPTTVLHRRMFNSLESPAERLNGDVRHVKQLLSQEPVIGHLMSGSGSACFGICRSSRQARQVAARLRARRIGRVLVAHTLF